MNYSRCIGIVRIISGLNQTGGVLVAMWLKCWPAIEKLQVRSPLGAVFFHK